MFGALGRGLAWGATGKGVSMISQAGQAGYNMGQLARFGGQGLGRLATGGYGATAAGAFWGGAAGGAYGSQNRNVGVIGGAMIGAGLTAGAVRYGNRGITAYRGARSAGLSRGMSMKGAGGDIFRKGKIDFGRARLAANDGFNKLYTSVSKNAAGNSLWAQSRRGF